MEAIWHIIGASVEGTSHQKKDIPCQDAHSYRVLPDGIALVAVADGAGSAEWSDRGARCAVERVIDSVEEALAGGLPQDDAGWKELLVGAFRQARQAVSRLAEAGNFSLRAFATTLTCAVVSKEWLVVGQIGDGVVVVKGEDGELLAVTQPQRGEYANETYFLTMTDALQRVDVQTYPRSVQALAAMTDGLIRLAMNLVDNEPHLPFFHPLFTYAAQVQDVARAEEQLAALLFSERVCDRTDDDKTLVLLARSLGYEPEALSEDEEQATDGGEQRTAEEGADAE